MEKEIIKYEQALLNFCKKTGAKSPFDLIGKNIKVIQHRLNDGKSIMYAKISYIEICVSLSEKLSLLYIKLEEPLTPSGGDPYYLVYDSGSDAWFYEYHKLGLESGKFDRYPTEIYFPKKKWFNF